MIRNLEKRPVLATMAALLFALTVSLLSVALTLPATVFSAQGKDFRKAADFEPGGHLNLKMDRSKVHLDSWDRNQVDVFAHIEPPENVSEDYARRAVEAVRIEVSGDAHSLTVSANFDDVPYIARGRNQSRHLPHVNFEIHAPRKLQLRAELDRSELALRGIEGDLNLETDRTTIEARDLAGKLRLKMDRGGATVTGLRGALDLDTDRTNVTLNRVQIDANSRLEARRGNIDLRVPQSQGLSIHANTGRREEFHTDLALTIQNMSRDRIEGTINGGGPELVVRTERGKVTLRRD
jgi:hypothetical protein